MITALIIVHSIVCVLLIAIVLLQFGKGAEAGLLMDSGASSILPQKGNIMTKITTVLAIIFLSLSLGLAIIQSNQSQESIFDKTAPMASPLGVDDSPETPADKAAEEPKK